MDKEIGRILRMTDEEVLAKVCAEGGDLDQMVAEMRAIFERAVCIADRLSVVQRATWARTSSGRQLVARQQDGGAVLATIESVGNGYVWQAAGKTGTHRGWYGATMAVRKALREEAQND